MNNTRLTQPEEMKTRAYVYGVEKLNGYDAWALFQACALGDLPKVKSLLAKDRRLVNAQQWYQFPIHEAVSAGHTEIVKLLLERGAGRSSAHRPPVARTRRRSKYARRCRSGRTRAV